MRREFKCKYVKTEIDSVYMFNMITIWKDPLDRIKDMKMRFEVFYAN